MRILLTGAKGQLGRSIRERLPDDWELIATDSHSLDITNRETVISMVKSFQPDVIINGSAFTSVSACEANTEKTFAVNAYGPRNLAEAARITGAKFVQISSDYVFSGNSRIPYLETDAPNPQSVYGQSKLAGEILSLSATHNTLLIRTSWVFSEYGENTAIPVLLRQAKEGKPIQLVDNQAACPTYAGDLANAIISLLKLPTFPAGIIHYCGNKALSAYKFAQAVFQAEQERNPAFCMPELHAITLAELASHSSRPQYSVLNCDKAVSLGLSPSDWQKSLPDVLAKLAQ